MINFPTVFILGAGASDPYYFPLGRRLLLNIHKQLGGDHDFIRDILDILECDGKFLEKFREDLIKSGQPSVDAFLEHREEYLQIGKVSIARALIPHEEEQLITIANQKKDNWYGHLFDKMDTPFVDLDKNKVSFITFNYDRSLEFYLLQTTIYRYGVSEKEAVEKLKNIPVIHLHGQLGVLPGYQKNDDEYVRPHSAKMMISDIIKCADNIEIIHETDASTPKFELAHEIIRKAKVRCFLGFGYNENNVNRLVRPVLEQAEKDSKWIRFLGSAFGIEVDDRKKIKSMFRLPVASRHPGIELGDEKHDALTFIRNNDVFL